MTSPSRVEAAREIHQEIEALHHFFVGWLSGALPVEETLFDRAFTGRFDPSFLLIPPGGRPVRLPALSRTLRRAHGSAPEIRITIRNVTLHDVTETRMLATYEEWQRHAPPPGRAQNGRLSTVLFARGASLRWLHVHETWLPEAVMEAGPYDF